MQGLILCHNQDLVLIKKDLFAGAVLTMVQLIQTYVISLHNQSWLLVGLIGHLKWCWMTGLCRICSWLRNFQVWVPGQLEGWCLWSHWVPLMWFAPNIFENWLASTFPYVSTVSLAPLFRSTLSHGHLPLCDIHTYTHTTTPLLVNKIWIDPTWLVGGK